MSTAPSQSDIENLKLDAIHVAEVATGKVGGSSTGADIDVSVNRLGGVRKTLPKAIEEVENTGSVLITPHKFDGDGVTKAFQLTVTPLGVDYVYAQLGGVPQLPAPTQTDGFTLSTDTPPKIVFNEPPSLGQIVYVKVSRGASGGGVPGEANTASNVGTSGVGVFKQKSGVDLQFKKIKAGSGVTVTATTNDEVEIGVSTSSSQVPLLFSDENIPLGTQGTVSTVNFTGSGVGASRNGDTVTVTVTSGVTDHGALTGLGDDDHTQYHTDARGDARYAVIAHTHTQAQSHGAPDTDAATTSLHHTLGTTATQAAAGNRGLPTGGSVNQVLSKVNGTDYNVQWVTSSSSGEANTASNLGTGSGVFAQKSGVDLQFKSIKGGTNVTVTNNADEVLISASSTAGGTVTHTTGALTANAIVIGNGGDDVKPVVLSGLVKANGASAPTAAIAGTDYLTPTAIGVSVQAYDIDLDSWSGKTAPTGTVVGTTDSQSLSSKTLVNPTITNYTETENINTGVSLTIDLSLGTVIKFTTTGNATITLPSAAIGKSYQVYVTYGGAHTITWVGGTAIKWAGGTAPVATSVSGKIDVYSFSSIDTSATLGRDGGRNY